VGGQPVILITTVTMGLRANTEAQQGRKLKLDSLLIPARRWSGFIGRLETRECTTVRLSDS